MTKNIKKNIQENHNPSINNHINMDSVRENDKIYVFFADSKHKIKKKAEQSACKEAIGRVKANK